MLFYSNHFRLILRGWQRQQVRCLRVLVMHATTIASALCQNQVQIKIYNEFLCQGRCRERRAIHLASGVFTLYQPLM